MKLPGQHGFQPPSSRNIEIPFSGPVVAYIKSLIQQTTIPAAAGGVTSVSVTGPITNTGTSTAPDIGLTTPLPVVDGGTGTATPGLVAGTNITLSGTWPNETINSTGGGGYPFTFVQVAMNYVYETAVGSITVTFPQTTAASGNTLIAYVFYDYAASTPTSPGWTLISHYTVSPYSGCAVYSKTSASDVTAVWSWGTGDFGSVVIWELLGSRTVTINSAGLINEIGGATGVNLYQLPFLTPPTGSWPVMLLAIVASAAGTGVSYPTWANLTILGTASSNRTAVVIYGKSAGTGNLLPPDYFYYSGSTYQTSIACITLYIT